MKGTLRRMGWSAALSRIRTPDPRPSRLFFITCVCLLTLKSSFVETQNVSDVSGSFMSDKMFRALWNGYQETVRPLCGSYPATTKVTLRIGLRQIQELNEPKQILTTNLWLRVAWSECRLTWNRTQWNIPRLVVPYKAIWTPDLTLYDNAESGLSGLQSYRIIVTSEGSVTQQVPVVVHSVCKLDVSRFPFDTQVCNLTFGSWAYDGHELNLSEATKSVDLGSYITHGEWEVLNFTSQRIEPLFSGVPYPQVIFTLALQRRHLFYVLSILFPCALIQMMAALAFLLPSETNEKVGLEITVLLSLAVMQLVILDMIPASSETLPLIGVYFMLAMIVVSLSCLMTVTVLAVHYPNRHRPLPRWSRAILDMKVAKWLGVDSTTIQQISKIYEGGNIVGVTDPDVTAQTLRNKNPQTTHVNKTHSSEMEMTSVCTLDADSSTNPSNAPNDFSDPFDVSSDTNVSFYYSIEGDRSKRVCGRSLSADAARLARQLAHPSLQSQTAELQDVVRLCQKLLQSMGTGGKKHGDAHEKVSNKAARREWELMAILLDRVFLVVYCLLTTAMFAYIYGSIV